MEGLDAEQVAEGAMKIAAEICVYTNDNFVKEVRGVLVGGGWGGCLVLGGWGRNWWGVRGVSG